MKFGVVGVQGDVEEHEAAADAAGAALDVDVDTVRVRESGVVPECDVVALPGGESTTISSLVHREGIDEEVRAHVDEGGPVLATCAGLILASSDAGDDRVDTLGLLDVDVERNSFGRQKESFEADVEIQGFDHPFPGVFIRAPAVTRVGDATVLAEHAGDVVAVEGGPADNVVGTSFHPELTDDHRLHEKVFEDAR